ncbi:MAG: hypothetical protein HRT88_06760 [Lentisphaeraceae bacterium]|nr:hypothetical protein [Lentisphaeraceae bacterium]
MFAPKTLYLFILPILCTYGISQQNKSTTISESQLWLQSWPTQKTDKKKPLLWNSWSGSYSNPGGQQAINQIFKCYKEGSAAGLAQDGFRSYCGNHSSIRGDFFPQIRMIETVNIKQILNSQLTKPFPYIFKDHITFGVESHGVNFKELGAGKINVVESFTRLMIKYRHEKGIKGFLDPYAVQTMYYTHNFLFTIPALASFNKKGEDRFTFLQPFTLNSIGASGTDTLLISPLITAAAAIPPKLKTRMIKSGLYTSSLMYLFKSYITGNLRDPKAHLAAYSLPAEAFDKSKKDTPMLASLIEQAHSLKHIPPAAVLNILKDTISTDDDYTFVPEAYKHAGKLSYMGLIRPGETLHLIVDLRSSWSDKAKGITLKTAYHKLLRGPATITPLNKEGTILDIRVTWKEMPQSAARTDILLLVNDGKYDSSPAYISIRHLHPKNFNNWGLKVRRQKK